MDSFFQSSNDFQFNGTLDELPFDVLTVVFSCLSLSHYFIASEETRNLKMVSTKMRKAVTTAEMPTWCHVSDYARLCEYMEKFLSRDRSKIIKSYRKYKTHFPLSRFANLAEIFQFGVDLNVTDNVNSCVQYLLSSNNVTPARANELLRLKNFTANGEFLVDWASWFDATVLSRLINIAGRVQLSTYKSAMDLFYHIVRTNSQDTYGGELMFRDINNMLFFKWKSSFLHVIEMLFELEKGNLEGRVEASGYTLEQYDAFCKEAKRYIRWIRRLTPRKLASANYYTTYAIYNFRPNEVQSYFEFLEIDTFEQIYEVPIISVCQVDRPMVYNMSIYTFVGSRGF